MKLYYCLLQNDPLQNQVTCYRLLRCEEVDSDDNASWDKLSQEFMQVLRTTPYTTTMLFHLPTKDVKTLMPPGLPEGVFYYDFLRPEGSETPDEWRAQELLTMAHEEAARVRASSPLDGTMLGKALEMQERGEIE